jgi:hypothetical protein
MEKINNFIKKNLRTISFANSKKIPDFDSRVINNIKEIGKIDLPENICTVYDLLLYVDGDNGKCKLEECKNSKKIKAGRKWVLNDFCSNECSSLSFSRKQKINNTSKKMTDESRKRMGSKISSLLKEKIKNGSFTPGVTNSWSRSKINVLINGNIFSVRSSWEAFFYVLNPFLVYESIRVQYFDTKSKSYRNYIVDFLDPVNRKLYEIKPKKKIESCENKEKAATDWCRKNGFIFVYITEEWIRKNYDRNLIKDQPEFSKISERIEKSLKYNR